MHVTPSSFLWITVALWSMGCNSEPAPVNNIDGDVSPSIDGDVSQTIDGGKIDADIEVIPDSGVDARTEVMNLVLNPGFEDDKMKWTKGRNASAVTNNMRSGAKCLRFRQVDVDGEVDETRQTIKGIIPGSSYEFSAWIKGVSLGGPKGVRLRYYWGKDGEELAPSSLVFSQNGSFEYTQAKTTIVAPPDANELEILYINYSAGTGVSYADDFSLVLN